MNTAIQHIHSKSDSKAGLWTGRILSGIAILFMAFDGVIHIIKNQPVIDAFNMLGLPIELSVPVAIINLVCLALYVYPRTSIFGAILLTGYLGGAVAIQLRIQTPLLSNNLFPVYVGILLWGGIFLRDSRLRSLIPFRKDEEI